MLADPGGRTPAPGPLRAVQAFVNTLDRENEIEELATPDDLRAVLGRLGLSSSAAPPLDDRDVAWAVSVREALRARLLANNGGVADRAADATLTRAASVAALAPRFEAGHVTLVSEAPGLDGALGRLVAVATTAMLDGSWERLKACPRDVCGWVFYDRSRNRSSRWCAMSVCGNRTKARAYRRRATSPPG